MPAAVDQDRTAFEGQAPGRMCIVTTFYALITALHESMEPGEDDLVTVAVVHLVKAGHVTYLDRPLRGAGSQPQGALRYRSMQLSPLTGKVAIMTGASKGIAAELAHPA